MGKNRDGDLRHDYTFHPLWGLPLVMSTVVGLVVTLFALVGAVLGLLWDRRLRRQLHQSFSPASWQHIGTRWKILDDLLNSYQLSGLHRQQVFDLLGPPDNDQGRIASCLAKSEKSKYHHVAYKLSDDNDSDWLVLHFDENDRVADYSKVYGW